MAAIARLEAELTGMAIRHTLELQRSAERASPQAVPAEFPSMPANWWVSVHADGDTLVTIGREFMSGERALEEQDEQTIIGAAKHLLAFVGYGLPPSNFNPDEAAPQAVDAPVAPDLAAKVDSALREAMIGATSNPSRDMWDVGFIEGVKACVTVVRAALASPTPAPKG
jgi:hypothetical protein